MHLHNDVRVKAYMLACNHSACVNLLMSGTVATMNIAVYAVAMAIFYTDICGVI